MSKTPYYVVDFETTTTVPTKVWAWKCVSVTHKRKKPERGTDIESFFKFCESISKQRPTIYFHNAKFDVSFLLYYIMKNNLLQWYDTREECTDMSFTGVYDGSSNLYGFDMYWEKDKRVNDRKINGRIVHIKDSLKIFNLSIEELAKTFGMSVNKSKIDYHRHDTDCEVTDEEWAYIDNDVQILKIAISELLNQGLHGNTLSLIAVHDFVANYKAVTGRKHMGLYPRLDENVDKGLRKAYRSGYNYINPNYAGVDVIDGIVLDNNSMYSHILCDRPLPCYYPEHYKGKYVNDEKYPLYIQNVKVKCKLKPNHIPAIQLQFSDVSNNVIYLINTKYVKGTTDEHISLSLTNMDLELLFAHYDIEHIEYVDGYKFLTPVRNPFKSWVDKCIAKKIEAEQEGNKGKRWFWKSLPNALVGKFATKKDRVNNRPVYNEELDKIEYKPIADDDIDIDEETGEVLSAPKRDVHTSGFTRQGFSGGSNYKYLPLSIFVNSWGRYEIITLAQKIHEESIAQTGVSRYVYSDTDSIHMVGKDIPEYIDIHPTDLGKWKVENSYCRAKYLGCKKYILDLGDNKLKVVCAGMPKRIQPQVTYDNFSYGQRYTGNLKPVDVTGGQVLVECDYTIAEKNT